MKISFTIFIAFISYCYSLQPNKLPNGSIKKFIPNKIDKSNDLQLITPPKASLIAKNWLQNIIADYFEKQKTIKSINYINSVKIDDIHIVTAINSFDNYIKDHKSKNDIYLAWKPKSIHGIDEVLFLIAIEIDQKKRLFTVKQLIQSPFWLPEQIESCHLKEALIKQNNKNNYTDINLDYLYENDLRFKLAWSNWHLNNDKN